MAFFENANLVGIPQAAIAQLAIKGIMAVGDLADFDKDSLQQLTDSLCKPRQRVLDPDPGVAAGATIPIPAFVFGMKSQKRLSVPCDLIRYYVMFGCDNSSDHKMDSCNQGMVG